MSTPPIPFLWAPDRETLPRMGGKPLIAHVVMNLEHWPFDAPMPRAILPGPHGDQAVPDVPNYSWVEYGMRCGLPRMLKELTDRDIPTSVACNASIIDAHPAAAQAVRDAGWEFVGHSLRQRSLPQEPDERAAIVETLDRLEAFTGVRPRGWLGPGLRESLETPTHLVEAGVAYVCDWPIDDLPVWAQTPSGPIIALPYALELNDSVVHVVERQPSSTLFDRLLDTLDTFDAELAHQPRVLTLGLHPHLMGVPHRVRYFARMLDALSERDDVIFATAGQIADWYADAEPFVSSPENADTE